jgi:CNT family concentrative nucleoside transporter
MKIEPMTPEADRDPSAKEPRHSGWRVDRRHRDRETVEAENRRERAEAERAERQLSRYERQRAERQRREREWAERQRTERERLGQERYERERIELERLERENRLREREEYEVRQRERLGRERYEQRIAERAAYLEEFERLERERLGDEQYEADLAERERLGIDPLEWYDEDDGGIPGASASTSAQPTPLILRAWLLMAVLFLTGFVYLSSGGIGARMQAFCGIFVIFGLVALFSKDLMSVKWQPIFFGFTMQVFLALFIVKFEINGMESLGIPDGFRPGYALFEWIGGFFRMFIDFAHRGGEFVFGALVSEEKLRAVFGRNTTPIFALSVIPTIIFVSSFFTVLYYFGILQFVVRIFSRGVMTLMGTSGAETLSAVANVFMGQVESPLVVKPYLSRMTTSELLAVMVGGMATISGSLMAIYIGFGADSVAILTTSVMAAPASLYLAKLLIPETETPVTANMVKTVDDNKHRNVIDAATAGASEGMKLAINIIAMLIAFIAMIELVNAFLRYFPTDTTLPRWLASADAEVDGPGLFWLRTRKYISTLLGFGAVVWILRWPFLRILKVLKLDDEYATWKKSVGFTKFVPIVLGYFLFLGVIDILMRTLPADLTLGQIFSSLFYPLALLMGVEEKDAGKVASLLGTKLATNEFVAFLDLKTLFADHQISPRSFRLATYALTGFANFASIGIQLGGIGAMVPERRHELARLGLAALFVGFLVTILNAAIVGLMLPVGDLP